MKRTKRIYGHNSALNLILTLVMGLMVSFGNELIRYNPSNRHIEYSTNRGASWYTRCSSHKDFIDLQDAGKEILASTSDGHLYYSTNKGSSWYRRR